MTNIHYLFNNHVAVLTNGTDVLEVKAQERPELFQQVVNLCIQGDSEEAFDLIVDSSEARFVTSRLAAITDGMLSVDPSTHETTFTATDGRRMTIVNTFANRIRDAWTKHDKKALEVYKAFMIKASNNPNNVSASDLFEFITVNKLPLAEDGDVLAYKIVSSKFMDLKTGKMDHSPGQVVVEDDVDYDRNNTCSRGLHFCSKDYLPSYGGFWGAKDTSNKLVLVKIDPAHVAAFPRDYNNAKGRCCQYTVVSELPTAFFTAIVTLMEQVPFVNLQNLGVSDDIAGRLGVQVDEHKQSVQQQSVGPAGMITDSVVEVPTNRWYVAIKADNQPQKLIYKASSRADARAKLDTIKADIASNSVNGTYMGMIEPQAFVYDAWT